MQSIAELARAARDEELVRDLPADHFESVFGGCMTQTCYGTYCIDDKEDDPGGC